MTRSVPAAKSGRAAEIAICGGILVIVAFVGYGCATGASAAGASVSSASSVYGSASAYVQLPPDQAFNPAVKMLLERGDIEITDLKEANNRCKAVAGDQKLTFRVIGAEAERSRLSVLVGGGRDRGSNQELADELLDAICRRLSVACE